MNARNHFFICILALLCFASSAAQNYPINAATNGTTILTCQGTIYDSGGPSGNYGNSQLYTVTFCSSNGSQLILDVLQFQIENFFDDLFVYDGPTTSSPLIVQATGNQIQGQSFMTTGTCVTLVFDTDGSVTNVGFAIDINCAFPCQAIEPQIAVDPLLTLGPDDEILACTGSQVTFNGSALFPENGDTYIQSIATSTFEWYVNGTLVFTGQVCPAQKRWSHRPNPVRPRSV
ncbi:MAG: CUB domain-containing protein, partial [Bacteroidetes bacterium]|nr:CUB domain-containing protein [Bacteroidota bacterium]